MHLTVKAWSRRGCPPNHPLCMMSPSTPPSCFLFLVRVLSLCSHSNWDSICDSGWWHLAFTRSGGAGTEHTLGESWQVSEGRQPIPGFLPSTRVQGHKCLFLASTICRIRLFTTLPPRLPITQSIWCDSWNGMKLPCARNLGGMLLCT